MLLNFSLKNYKSIREEVDLSMFASSLKENGEIPANAYTPLKKDYHVLPVAVVYGANASGKSNLLKAMGEMKNLVLTSFAVKNVQDKIPVESFAFSSLTENKPSSFEISFYSTGQVYRYGFETSREKIFEEWLYVKELKPRSQEKELFYRNESGLEKYHELFKVGKIIKEQKLVKDTVLVITLANQLNDEAALKTIHWFGNFNVLQGHRDEDYSTFSKNQIEQKTSIAGEMEKLVLLADINIQALGTSEMDGETEITATHTYYNDKDQPAGTRSFPLSKHESEGTKKLFNFSGPILNTLKHRKVLVIDEMDSKLHPNLMEKLVFMFQDKKINPLGAQLIFATHNTNLLNAKILRRDQVWLTEKNRFGATQLYSIADFKTTKGKARNTEAIEHNYIEGKYGGVPFLGELENFFEEFKNEQRAQ